MTRGIAHGEFKKTPVGEIPVSWTVSKLIDVCEKIQDGSHFSPSVQYQSPGHNRFLYVTSKNIKENGVDLSDATYVDIEFHKGIYSRCNPEKGDVLLIKDGAMTGVAVINNVDQPFSLLSSVALLKSLKQVLDARYLKYYLDSPLGFRMITNQMTGTAIKRIVLDKIRMSLIPLPPIAEQKKIADILYLINTKVNLLTNYNNKMKEVQRGLMQQLLTGKLRVKV